MFADHTLTPKEASRLCALGALALKPMSYAELATAIRHFISRVVGPTPEIMGHSIELLKYEGLIEAPAASGEEEPLRLTEAGREAMRALLMANIRANSSELKKLVIALKFRFLHLLPPEDQRLQVLLLGDATEREIARLSDLKAHHAEDEGYLPVWLDQDIAALQARLAWLQDFGRRIADVPPAAA